jgi:predicted TIM-barrel enzyme
MTRFRHSRECGNPGKSIPPRRETPAFAGVTALETFYETIKIAERFDRETLNLLTLISKPTAFNFSILNSQIRLG